MSSVTSHWNIISLDTIQSLDGLSNVISIIHCEKIAVSEDGFKARWYGIIPVSAPHQASFVPYEQVTEDMIIKWINESPLTSLIDANLKNQIELKKNPPIMTLPLPWISAT